MRREQVQGVLAAAVAVALAACGGTALGVVQDYNHARGSDGFTLTHPGNGFYQATGTFDGDQFQPTPTGVPGARGEFFYAGSDGGFNVDVRAPLGQGATWDQGANLATGDNGGYLYMDFFHTGEPGYPTPPNTQPPYAVPGSFWFAGAGNDAGPLPGGDNVDYSKVLAYADVLAPAGKYFEFRVESDYTFQGNGLKFVGVGTGGWQTVGGTLSGAAPYGSLDTSDPNLAMLVAFGTPGHTEIGSWDGGGTFAANGAAVLRWDNLTLTPATSSWKATNGGNWTSDANWTNLAPSGRNAVAVFGPSAAHQTVTLDTPVIPANDDWPYQNSFYVGTLQLNSPAGYTIAGTQPLVIDTTAANGTDLSGPNGTIQVLAGNHEISAPVQLNRTTNLDVAAGTQLTLSGVLTARPTAGVIKSGGGTAIVNNLRVASVSVTGGLLKVAPDGGAGGAGATNTVAVSGGGKLDLTNNGLAVRTTPIGTWTGSAYDGVTGLVAAGRGSGSWDGGGITTSSASGKLTGLGVAKAGDVLGIADTATQTWRGQTVTGTDTLIMFTYAGDANLDGKINIDDYGKIDGHVGIAGSTGWFNGDFNYDGHINIDDYGIIDANVANQGPPLSGAAAGLWAVGAVPEPSCAVLFAALSAGAVARRRRGTNR